jgi:hypothetical protein
MMTLKNPMYCVSALGLVLAAACTGRDTPATQQELTQAPAATLAAASPTSRLEVALGDIDLGHDPAATRASLETLVASGGLQSEDSARAKLGLSRLAEAAGDTERAITLLEEAAALGTQVDGIERRLYELSTGRPLPSMPELVDAPVVAPIARALSKWFEPGSDHRANINVIMLGGGDTHRRLGTYAIGASLREHQEARCPSCDATKLDLNEWNTQHGDWTGLFRALPKLGTSLVVFYLDHETMIPSRYDSYLPVPSAEIDAHLQKGEGYIAVKTRGSAPPVIVLAAPRRAQVEKVEEAFAKMKELPKAGVAVPLPAGLTNREIKLAIRGSFTAFHGCFDALIAKNNRAAGNMVASFAARADGTVDKLRVELDHGLDDPSFRSCVEGVWKGITFPKTGENGVTTVVYPTQFTSDAE